MFVLLNVILLLPGYLAYLDSSRFFPFPWPSESGGLDRSLLHLIRRPDQDLFRLHVDLVLLLSIAVFASAVSTRRLVQLTRSAFFALFAYAVYEAVVGRLFHRDPTLADDAAFFPGAVYLALDLMTWGRALLLLSGVLVLGLVCRWAMFLVRTLVHVPREHAIPHLRPVLLGFWLLYLPLGLIYGLDDFSLEFRSTTARAVTNGVRSVETVRTLTRLRSEPVDSTYFGFRSLTLQTRPDIYLFMVESYGTTLATDPVFSASYRSLLDTLGSDLAASGWHARTSHSIAPVYGGISWLSIASVLGGLKIDTHALHSLFVQHAADYPHLVDLLDRWGYRTITLQPPNRKKPGLPLVNPFQFQIPVFGEDLPYAGTPYGLWAIPDQYSLGFTHDLFVSTSEQPVFLFFETVSTHAPWESIPPLADDWRSLQEPGRAARPPAGGPVRRLFRSVKNRLGARPEDAERRYLASIRYDLRTLARYLIEEVTDSTSVVLIVGDHQPPIVADGSYGTPVHILSRDADLLQPLREMGFSEGLFDAFSTDTALKHEAIFSLIVTLLSRRHAAATAVNKAGLRPEGIPASILAHGR